MEDQKVEETLDATGEASIEAEAQANTEEQPQGPDLNVSDLAGIKSIIEVATQRGAFKANELEAVGKIFNKLEVFLEAVGNQKAG